MARVDHRLAKVHVDIDFDLHRLEYYCYFMDVDLNMKNFPEPKWPWPDFPDGGDDE
jgi:hypothetical protein